MFELFFLQFVEETGPKTAEVYKIKGKRKRLFSNVLLKNLLKTTEELILYFYWFHTLSSWFIVFIALGINWMCHSFALFTHKFTDRMTLLIKILRGLERRRANQMLLLLFF